MGRLALFGAALAAVLCVASVPGTGLAAVAGGNPSPPGHEGSPPGQSGKVEEDSGTPSPAGQAESPRGHSAKADEDPGKPSAAGQEQAEPQQSTKVHGKPGKPWKASQTGQERTPPGQSGANEAETASAGSEAESAARGGPEREDAAPAGHPKGAHLGRRPKVSGRPTSVPSKGNSSVAHTHVIICHRTGSASHPYVVINISMEGWLHGHTTHPALDGHSDKVLKQGARPGEKLSVSACGDPGVVPPTQSPPTTGQPPTAPPAPSTTGSRSGTTPTGTQGARPSRKSTRSDSGAAGRLGYTVVTGSLPFTGVPLWIVVLAACALLGGGLALRKGFRTESAETRVTDRD